MSKLRQRKRLITQLIRAARGQWSPSVNAEGNVSTAPKLPCFPLQKHHFGKLVGASRVGDKFGAPTGVPSVATPSDFHSHLCDRIEHAQERIVIASLYVGVGTYASNGASEQIVGTTGLKNSKEDALLQALQYAATNNNLKKIQVLLDANRALRKVSLTNMQRQSHEPSSHLQTNSAEAVLSRLYQFLKSSSHSQNSGLFLFPVNDRRLCTILPSPLDEVAGVFHIKAYIVDDELILSGANLSEEYFSSRLDRYMLFTNGGGGLVDFYANLCDTLSEYAVRYDGYSSAGSNSLSWMFSLHDEKTRREKLERSLMHLFDGGNQAYQNGDSTNSVAYAIPTFQMPTSFLGRQFRLQSDKHVTRNLLFSALKYERSASVRLSSAYLNLTPNLLSVLTEFGKKNVGAPYVVTAGPISHGFAPKQGSPEGYVGIVEKIKSTIPKAFFRLVMEVAQLIMSSGGKILLYERPGWTFHSKGIWITANDGKSHLPETINNSSSLLSTIIGSGNYGARSEDLDVESNCILIFNDTNKGNKNEDGNICAIKEYVAADWNNMCASSNELPEDVDATDKSNKIMQVVLQFMKRYL
mmetsp:Transcript_5529/g.12066  ORF Transcript_5529/g.12066 Transcript_5529/m.12066 type:complete len:582 (-) Transcript_5529:50-1795(-)